MVVLNSKIPKWMETNIWNSYMHNLTEQRPSWKSGYSGLTNQKIDTAIPNSLNLTALLSLYYLFNSLKLFALCRYYIEKKLTKTFCRSIVIGELKCYEMINSVLYEWSRAFFSTWTLAKIQVLTERMLRKEQFNILREYWLFNECLFN